MLPETVVTIANAAQILSIGLDIAMKAKTVLDTADPSSIDDELRRLDAARLRPSAEIIAEADKEIGK